MFHKARMLHGDPHAHLRYSPPIPRATREQVLQSIERRPFDPSACGSVTLGHIRGKSFALAESIPAIRRKGFVRSVKDVTLLIEHSVASSNPVRLALISRISLLALGHSSIMLALPIFVQLWSPQRSLLRFHLDGAKAYLMRWVRLPRLVASCTSVLLSPHGTPRITDLAMHWRPSSVSTHRRTR